MAAKDPKAISSPPAEDPEKGAAGLKAKTAAEAEEFSVVDARKALLIKIGCAGWDIIFVVYLLFCVGLVALMVMMSDKSWHSWPGILILSPICITTLWLTPMMKDVYIKLYATKKVPGSNSDLSTKLLATEK